VVPKAPEDATAFLEAVCTAMPHLAKALFTPSEGSVHLPVGLISPPLGKLRLGTLQFFSLLLRSYKNVESVQRAFVEHKVAVGVAEILFSHPWHNIAHFYVQEILTHCLDEPSLRTALHEDAQLPTKIVEVMNSVPPPPEEGTAPDRSYHRLGCLGTVIELAKAIEASVLGAGEAEFKPLKEEGSSWNAMCQGTLAEEIRKQALELGRGATPDLSRFAVNDDSSSSDDGPLDPDNNSSGSSDDEDDDPLRHWSGDGGGTNNMADAFRQGTMIVNDGADAWDTQEITDASAADGDWVANFDTAPDPWGNPAVSEEESEAWKADFDSADAFGGAAGVEDPFAAAEGEAASESPFEADFSNLNVGGEDADADTVDVGFGADFSEPAVAEEAGVEAGGESPAAAVVSEEPSIETASAAVGDVAEVMEELAGGEEVDLQYLSEMKPTLEAEEADEVVEEVVAGSPAVEEVAEEVPDMPVGL